MGPNLLCQLRGHLNWEQIENKLGTKYRRTPVNQVDQHIRKSLRSKDGLVFYPAHNPKVVSSNLTPATNLTDSQGLVGCFQQALLLFGKDLGKKSVFLYQSQAIRSRTIHQVFRLRSVHRRRKYECNRPPHYFRCGPDAACESAVGCQENPLLWPPCDGNRAALETPHVSRSALPVQSFSLSPQTSLVAWNQSSESRLIDTLGRQRLINAEPDASDFPGFSRVVR
jgi:hypothetical protein